MCRPAVSAGHTAMKSSLNHQEHVL
jgi:hypothetical protein